MKFVNRLFWIPLIALPLLFASHGCDTITDHPDEFADASRNKSVGPVDATDAKPRAGHSDSTLISKQVSDFCGACHATPQPEHYPKAGWEDEVVQGYRFHYEYPSKDRKVPAMAKVIAYYVEHAPDQIPLPPKSEGAEPNGLFQNGPVTTVTEVPPAVAHVNWVTLGKNPQLVACDMGSGTVQLMSIGSNAIDVQTIATLSNPAHAEVVDLDGDGARDLVIGDLGSQKPVDHDAGRVIWLRRVGVGNDQVFETNVLASGLGRVADVQPSDLDLDGDLDLIVCDFGWRKTGRVFVMENIDVKVGNVQFKVHEVDPRHGAIHGPPVDLNRDGRPDFVTLFAQEHECIDAMMNEGSMQFRPQRLFSADRPSYGSSGISLVDMDGDRDLDVLYTNGDIFDDKYLRHYHAIQWIENGGSDAWEHHVIANLPGVHRALATDFDRDGDLDIVASAFVSDQIIKRNQDITLDSLIWLEQKSAGEFQRHVIEAGLPTHAAMTHGDFDSDGDEDLAVGTYATQPDSRVPSVQVWWNQAGKK